MEDKVQNTHRLFLASFATIENYKELKQQLGTSFHGKWVKENNLHMTFKFLGDIADPELIINKLKGLKYQKKHVVHFNKLKLFNKKILSIRSSNKTIYKIHDQINELLGEQFYKENENFKPHITLMRVKSIKNKDYKELFKNMEAHGEIEIKIALVESKLNPEGVKYKILREF